MNRNKSEVMGAVFCEESDIFTKKEKKFFTIYCNAQGRETYIAESSYFIDIEYGYIKLDDNDEFFTVVSDYSDTRMQIETLTEIIHSNYITLERENNELVELHFAVVSKSEKYFNVIVNDNIYFYKFNKAGDLMLTTDWEFALHKKLGKW